MNKVIVTGATGFIGRKLCESLLDKGIVVYGIGRNSEILSELSENVNFHPIALDFSEYDKIEDIIYERDFDIFFHMAHFGVNGRDKFNYKIQLENTAIACSMVEKAKLLGCKRFVFSGSVDEYEAYFKPDDSYVMPSHSRIYGIAKFASENIGKTIALELGIEYVGVVLALTYGEGNATNILPNTIIRNSLLGTSVKLIKGNGFFDMIYVEEAVQGIIAVAQKGDNLESYYVGHEELRTFKDCVESMCEVLNTNIDLRFGEYKDPDYMTDYSVINRNKLYETTGYRCDMNFESTILNTKEWLVTYDLKNKEKV